MDTALFYPSRMALAHDQALRICTAIVATARRFGGTLVVNWHDRSLSPERLWGRFYRELLDEVASSSRVWFALAREAVAWFRWRRSIRFTRGSIPGEVTVTGSPSPLGLPAGVIRIYRPGRGSTPEVEELRFDGRAPVSLAL
jgi:hypothetical protein